MFFPSVGSRDEVVSLKRAVAKEVGEENQDRCLEEGWKGATRGDSFGIFFPRWAKKSEIQILVQSQRERVLEDPRIT